MPTVPSSCFCTLSPIPTLRKWLLDTLELLDAGGLPPPPSPSKGAAGDANTMHNSFLHRAEVEALLGHSGGVVAAASTPTAAAGTDPLAAEHAAATRRLRGLLEGRIEDVELLRPILTRLGAMCGPCPPNGTLAQTVFSGGLTHPAVPGTC